MPTYPALYTDIVDGTDANAAGMNSRLQEISNAIGQIGDGSAPLASPDITSFVNSVHLHTNDATGGQMPFDNLDTTGSTAGQKWVSDGAGGGSWVSGFPILAAIVLWARISDVSNQWLRLDGRTIGNATSGGTARANADMEDLFTHLWSEFTNTELIIQDSTGTPTTRGANAAADWAADKRMPLIDMRGRTVAGMDDPTGAAAANRVTDAEADALGGSMGEEDHTLTESELAAHGHQLTQKNDGTLPLYNEEGGTARNIIGEGGATDSTDLLYSQDAGSDGAHNNMQPTLFLNYFIYTGN